MSMIDSPHTHIDEHRSARGYDHGRGQQVGEEEQGEGREDERNVRRQRKRWCTHDVKRPRGRAIATAPTPSAENGVARGGGCIRGERKEVERRTRWWQLRRGPSLSCRGIDG
jgi:hypothetical protein